MIRINFIVIFTLGVLPYAIRSEAEAQQVFNNTFPKDFLFGVTTSAPRYEGAWNKSGQSVWDYMTHANPALVEDGSNIDVANDFYHKYKEDVRRAKSIGTQMFRLSLSWTRILPNGFTNHVSNDGVKFYENLLDEIIANGMIPMVTIFQWDLPYNMQKMGGLTNPMFVDWFVQYAKFVFATFGDKVKFWVTISEPNNLCANGYGYIYFIPSLNLPAIADYICGHYALLAHAKAYRLYEREFRARQNGTVGITNDYIWYVPANSSSEKDVTAAEVGYRWYSSWLMDPIFSSAGDYPRIMRERIASNSRAEGFAGSRLPSFTWNEIRDVRGSADFLGVNYFTQQIVKVLEPSNVVSYDNDAGVVSVELLPRDAPSSFAKVMQRLNKEYRRPTFFITENGFPDSNSLDTTKVTYLQRHLAEVLKAIQSGMDIRGYMVWSLLDCFDWQFGYQPKYGLFRVDFNSTNLTRTPRLSSQFIARVYKRRRLENFDVTELLSKTISSIDT